MMHEREISDRIIAMRKEGLTDNEIYAILVKEYPPAEINLAYQSLSSSPPKKYPVTKKTIFRSFMILLLIITLYWFTSSGWSSIIFTSIDNVLSSVNVDESITSGMKHGLNCIWILISDPASYNDLCLAEKPPAEELYGIEIKSMSVTPKEPLAKSAAKLYFILENMGSIDAGSAILTVETDTDFTEYDGVFEPSEKSVDFSGSKETQLFMPFTTPRCPGSYELKSSLKYDYSGTSTLNLDIMDAEEYRIRSEQDRLEKKDVKSQSTSGPVTLIIQTSSGDEQPLSSEYPLALTFRLENNREGEATLTDIYFEIHDILIPKKDGYCDLKKDGDIYLLKDTETMNKIPSRTEADPLIFSCEFDINQDLAEEIATTRTYFIKSSFDYEYTIEKSARFETQGTGLDDGC